MAQEWELHDGAAQVGPLAEDHVLRMIAAGIPESTLIRPAGSEKWKSLRAHAPFAMALERRASTLAVVAPPPSPAVPPPAPSTAQSDARLATVVAYVRGLPKWGSLHWVALGGAVAVGAIVLALFATSARTGPQPATGASARPAYNPRFASFSDAVLKGTAGTLTPGDGATSVVVVPTRDALARFRERYMVLDADGIVDFLNVEHAAAMPGGTSVVILDRTDVDVRIMFEFQGARVVGFTLPPFVKVNTPARAVSVPASVPRGTWAKIPRPGEDIPDTTANRVAYMANVLAAVPGEPPVNKPAGLALLNRVRAEMAKQFSVPMGSMKVNVGDAGGSIIVATGAHAGATAHGEEKFFPACSEAVFASSIIMAGLEPKDFAKAGVRGVICKSDGCSGVFDMRPTSSGGGLYGGETCLSMEAMVNMAMGKP
jgi:hypothetical protein